MMGWTVDGNGAKQAGLKALSCNGSGVACAKHAPFPDGFPRHPGLRQAELTGASQTLEAPKPTAVVARLNDEGSPPSFDSSRLA